MRVLGYYGAFCILKIMENQITREEFDKAFKVVILYRNQLKKEYDSIDMGALDNYIIYSKILSTRMIDADISVRALNFLRAQDIDTLGELVSYNKNELFKLRNCGKKSIVELEEFLDSNGLSFGMKIIK